MMNGIFGDMYDFNSDGQLDSLESAMEFGFMQSLLEGDVTELENEVVEISDFVVDKWWE